MKQVQRAFKYRFYPTREQEQILLRSIGATRRVWNWGLDIRTRAWEERKERITSFDLMRLLSKLKLEKETAWLNEISAVVLQQCLRDQERAFTNFFTSTKGIRKGVRVGYPRFKSHAKAKKSLRYVGTAFRFKGSELYLAKMAQPLNLVWSRPLPEGTQPSSVTVSRDASGRWFASILVEDSIEALDPTGSELRSVGIDLGLKSFAVFSDGTVIEHPKFLKKSEARLAQYQRRFAKTKPGSKNRAKAKVKVAKVHAKVADQRKDWLHKLTTYIIQHYDQIFIEDLAVANMVRNHKLAKSISDSAWGMAGVMLTYKSEWYGRELVMINRWVASSRTCFECKWYNHELKLSDRTWLCLGCGTLLDRDLNAAKNIMAEGLSVLEKRKRSQEVCFDLLEKSSKSGEVRPKVEVIASTSRKARFSPVNQKPSMITESYAVA